MWQGSVLWSSLSSGTGRTTIRGRVPNHGLMLSALSSADKFPAGLWSFTQAQRVLYASGAAQGCLDTQLGARVRAHAHEHAHACVHVRVFVSVFSWSIHLLEEEVEIHGVVVCDGGNAPIVTPVPFTSLARARTIRRRL